MSISKKLKPCAMLVCTHTKQPKLMFIWLTIKVLTVQEASLEKRETQHLSSWENEEADIREKTKKTNSASDATTVRLTHTHQEAVWLSPPPGLRGEGCRLRSDLQPDVFVRAASALNPHGGGAGS